MLVGMAGLRLVVLSLLDVRGNAQVRKSAILLHLPKQMLSDPCALRFWCEMICGGGM